MQKTTQPIREFMLTSGSAQIAVRTAGNPDADHVLIIIHGGPGLSYLCYHPLETLASSELLVVGYDQRGCGRSSTSGDDDFTHETYVQDLEAVRSAVAGQKKVHLFGHSWGGYVSMAYAIAYPERVRSLLQVNSIPPTFSGFSAGMQRFHERLQEKQQRGLIPMELSSDQHEWLIQVLPNYLFETEEPVDFPAENIEVSPYPVSEKTFAALGEFDWSAQVATLHLPVKILFGDVDPFGVEWGEETRDTFTSAEIDYEVIPNCGHLGWAERPEAFLGSVRNFIERH